MILKQVVQEPNLGKDWKQKNYSGLVSQPQQHQKGGWWAGTRGSQGASLLSPRVSLSPPWQMDVRASGSFSLSLVPPAEGKERYRDPGEYLLNKIISHWTCLSFWTTPLERMDYFRNSLFFFNHALRSKQPANRLKSGTLNRQTEKLKCRWLWARGDRGVAAGSHMPACP